MSKFKYIINCWLVMLSLFFTNTAQADYLFGFFNGVFNDKRDAYLAVEEFRLQRGAYYDGELVSYESFYNVTGSEIDGETFLHDIQETLDQRANELTDKQFERRMEYAWELKNGTCHLPKPEIAKLNKELPGISGFCNKMKKGYDDRLDAAYSRDPVTASDYEKHNDAILNIVYNNADLKWMLVAHSQGNLFMNHAYEYMIALTDPYAIGIYHIAPASNVLYGKYILNSKDLVITKLTGTPEPNVTVIGDTDFLGHELLRTYYSKNAFVDAEGVDSDVIAYRPTTLKRTNDDIDRIMMKLY